VTTYVPDRRRLVALEREYDKRSNEAGGAVAWLERELVNERRNLAAAILRAIACGWTVSPQDADWAAWWVSRDEGWDPMWAALPDEVSRGA
jgi:hypothetical protein